MLDIGMSELMLIGVVALIVVGPKDLPIMFKTLGRFTSKARSMGREFQRAMDDAVKQSGVSDTLKDVKGMTSKKALGLDALEQAASKFEKWNPSIAGAKPASPVVKLASAAPLVPAPMPATPTPTPAPAPEMGPATKALAEKRAAERAARLAPKETTPQVAKPEPAKASKAPAKPRAAKAKAADSPASDAAKPAKPAAKAAPKSRSKKSQSE